MIYGGHGGLLSLNGNELAEEGLLKMCMKSYNQDLYASSVNE